MAKNKNAPSGLNYSDIYNIVEQIATEKARQYKKIAFYDEDDIKQEVRIKCLNTIKNFDPNRSGANLKIFLAVCADNRLKDIRRSIIYKHTSPCTRCPFWNEMAAVSGVHDCVIFCDKNQCDKFKKHNKYVMSKLSINSPISIEEHRVIDDSANRNVDRADFIDYLFEQVPSGRYQLFNKFRSVNFNLSSMRPKERIVIIEVLKEIIDLGDFNRG